MRQVLLIIPLQPSAIRVLLIILDFGRHRLGYKRLSFHIISLLRDSDVNLVGNRLDPRSLEFLLDPMRKEGITSGVSDVHYSLFRVCRGFNDGDGLVGDDGLDI